MLSTVTFDSPQSAFHPDSIAQMLGAQQRKSFMLHYEFPQFAVNEIGSSGNRREIGHGILAEKALKHLVPIDFPYTIRLASQVYFKYIKHLLIQLCRFWNPMVPHRWQQFAQDR